ncbi:UNVERIFIED_CONTAM: Receptor protein kinase-like protein ZAR1 [Sesamum calycinum]|uniref:Receptor protein kinase-like protein ZAR1 n=1 Tax=Sesamum calycinum TaxID=2727403 RepID=A0AAW2N6A5_9LAMI
MKHSSTYVVVLNFLYFFTVCISFTSSVNSDGLSLLALKAAIAGDPTHVLVSWSGSDSTPCNWTGITCDPTYHKVTSISLSSKNLTGYIPSEIGALSFLTFLDLSHNSFSGPLPYDITTLQNLVHLDISSNNFNGSLPENLSNLTHLTGTLNLSYNAFSGEVPPSFGQFPVMVSLDLRHNNFTGKIPQVGSLLNQGPTAFSGNPYLCGFPLSNPCTVPAEAQNPRFLNNPENPGISSKGLLENRKIKSGLMAVSVVFGVSLVVGMVFASVWVVKRKWKMEEGKTVMENAVTEAAGGEEGRRVVVSGGKGVGGPEVVAVRRLSEAEGDAMWRFKEFEAEVEAIGRVQHPNIVRLRACYYASDEKLLVSDFISNGSLHNALHGLNSPPLSWAARLRIAQEAAKGLMHIHECSNRKYTHGNIRSSKILLDDDLKPYISGFGLSRLVPGTSKSANSASRKQKPSQTVVGSKTSTSSTVMYVAPEAREAGSRFTQKCDVYSFGIVLLEILTGRLPDGGPDNDGKGLEGVVRKVFLEERPLSEVIDPALLHEVHAKKQVVATFHVALSCTELDPDQRQRMRTVCDNLDCIKL